MEELCLTNHISPLAYQSMYNDYLFNKIHNEQVLNAEINKQLIMTESTTLAQKENYPLFMKLRLVILVNQHGINLLNLLNLYLVNSWSLLLSYYSLIRNT